VRFNPKFTPQKISLQSLLGWNVQGLDAAGRPTSQAIFVTTPNDKETKPNMPAEPGPPATPDLSANTEVSPTYSPNNGAAGLDPAYPQDCPDCQDSKARQDSKDAQVLTPFFLVERVISLGLDWKVLTTVTHYGPVNSPVSLSLPLIPGETPTTPGLLASGGQVVLNFSNNQNSRSFESDLVKDLDRPIELKAMEGDYAESWTLDAASVWRVTTEGLTSILNVSSVGYYNPVWRPWPGETLAIKVSRLEPVPGQYLTIDRVDLNTTVGEQNRRHNLSFELRSSQGGTHSFDLSQGSKLDSLSVNGHPLPIPLPPESGLVPVTVPISPGNNFIEASWLDRTRLETITKNPTIDLKAAAANIRFVIDMPKGRWTLWADGPVQGPAVLFWSFAGAILILSLILARVSSTPLKTISWFLLFIGLSQLNLFYAFLVAGWLVALGIRGSRPIIKGNFLFNISQILLVFWTFLALVLIYLGLQRALLAAPAMRVAGNGSFDSHLAWFVDRTSGLIPQAYVVTIPDKIYHYIMLAWALWLAISIIGWLRWSWHSFAKETFWKKSPKIPRKNKKEAISVGPVSPNPPPPEVTS
jgi:hypothetical protein